MAGIPLDRYLQSKGPLSSVQVARIAAQVVRKAAREFTPDGGRAPVLTPARIVVGPGSEVAVAAGTAATGPVARAHPAYASPEESQGIQGDHRAQFYSFGCTVYELLTGEPPYTGDVKSVLRGHAREPIPDPAAMALDLDPMLGDLIFELLEKDPRLRLADVKELDRRLQECARSAAAGMTPGRTPATVAGRPRRGAGAPPGRPMRGATGRRVGAAPRHGQSAHRASHRTRRTGRVEYDEYGDPIEPTPIPARRRPKPVTWMGVALGVIASLLVALKRTGGDGGAAEAQRASIVAEKRESLLSERKKRFRDQVDAEAATLATAITRAKEAAASGESLSHRQSVVQLIVSSNADKLGAIVLADTFDALEEEGDTPEISADEVKEYLRERGLVEATRDEGKFAEALEAARTLERKYPAQTEETDELILAISDAMTQRWEKDQAEFVRLLGAGSYDEALAIARDAIEYGDSEIRRLAEGFQQQARAEIVAAARREGVGVGASEDEDADGFDAAFDAFQEGDAEAPSDATDAADGEEAKDNDDDFDFDFDEDF